MQSIVFKEAQQNLDPLCLQAWQETQYLLSSPTNAQRLLRSLEQARNGRLTERELLEE